MKYELFIALRYLKAKRKQAFISVISLISVAGVSLGVAALIIVLGVMNGFSKEWRDKIIGVNAHLVVASVEGGITGYRELARKVETVKGVTGVAPFTYTEVMASTPGGVKGVILRGIDPESAVKVLGVGKDIIAGSVADLDRKDLPAPGIVVGSELADRLSLRPGGQVNVMAPAGRKSAAGFTPQLKLFTVVGVFKTGMYEYDSSLAYVSLGASQELLGFTQDAVSGLELKVSDVYAVEAIGETVKKAIGGFPYYVRNWIEMNANLFAALKLEKIGMFVMLTLIILVASFSIITTLVMLVMEKTRDIAILMSMGATRKSIRRIFILQGTIIGVVGTTIGYVLGLSLAWGLKRYQFIKLPKDVYPMDHLPILLQTSDLIGIGVISLAMCFLATLYPAGQASRLAPAEALRYE